MTGFSQERPTKLRVNAWQRSLECFFELPTVEIAIPLLVVVSAALKPVLYSQTRVMDAVNKMLTPEPLRSLRLYLTYK
jgi:hypothetical protein